MFAPAWCLKLGDSRKKKRGIEAEATNNPKFLRDYLRSVVAMTTNSPNMKASWQFQELQGDAYSPSASEWPLLISYNRVVCACWMYRRHLVSNSI
jgi:hypothetical protein